MPLNGFRNRLHSLLAVRYVRYVMGMGVAVLFEPLLELFPEDSKLSLIPLAAFLMGLVAVAVQFYSGEVIRRKSIRRPFTFGFIVILLAFAGLVILRPKHVLSIPDPLTGRNEPVILYGPRLPWCPCKYKESALKCVYAVGIDSLDICWLSISQAQLSLHLLCLTLMGGFGGLIGLLLAPHSSSPLTVPEPPDNMTKPTPIRSQVFISYSRKDKRWLDHLQKMLKPLEMNRTLQVWADSAISPGDKWEEEIRQALASAKIAVFLVSSNFLASEFIAQKELPQLLQAADKILWILVSQCLYEETPIGAYQAAHDSKQALDEMSRSMQNRVLSDFARTIREASRKSVNPLLS